MLAYTTPASTLMVLWSEIVTPSLKCEPKAPPSTAACRHAMSAITAYVSATPAQYGSISLRKRCARKRRQFSASPARYAAMVSESPLIIMNSGTPWKPSRNSRSVSEVKTRHGPSP